MRRLGVKRIYVKENFYEDGTSMYTVTKPLLESQGFDCYPTSGAYPFDVFEPGLQFDINLDAWRIRPGRDRVHIINNMMLHYRCFDRRWKEPWLYDIPDLNSQTISLPWNLIFLTPRWRERSTVDWDAVMRLHSLGYHNTHFIGLPSDYEYFKSLTKRPIPHWRTANLLEMALLIKVCNKLYCNQGVALTIAQGLGKPYWLERKPGKTNTLLYTPKEHLL